MKQTRIAVFDQIEDRPAAALLLNGKLEDLIIDPKTDRPLIGAFYRAKVGRLLKGQGGALLDLGGGNQGFLKGAKGLSPGDMLTVQVTHYADPGKATPMGTKLTFKSAYAIITPGAKGYNIAKSIKDEEARDLLAEIANAAMDGAPEDWGLIIRSGADGIDPDAIIEDIDTLRALARDILADDSREACLLYEPDALTRAFAEWTAPPPAEIVEGADAFERLGVWDHIEALKGISTPLPSGGSFTIEPTSAFVAVDVNTGSDFSLMAGQKANMETALALPKALRLRGLGGQVVVDFAPSPKKDRRLIEDALRKALRLDGIDTVMVGWTTLGHFELQRKRERLALGECV